MRSRLKLSPSDEKRIRTAYLKEGLTSEKILLAMPKLKRQGVTRKQLDSWLFRNGLTKVKRQVVEEKQEIDAISAAQVLEQYRQESPEKFRQLLSKVGVGLERTADIAADIEVEDPAGLSSLARSLRLTMQSAFDLHGMAPGGQAGPTTAVQINFRGVEPVRVQGNRADVLDVGEDT